MKPNLQKRTASVDSLRTGAIGKRRRPSKATHRRRATTKQASAPSGDPGHHVVPIQASASPVPETPASKRDDLAEKWRRAGQKIFEEVERGRACDLESESPDDFVHTLTAAAEWGLTFRQVSDEDMWVSSTKPEAMVAMLRQLFDAGVNPEGWIVSRAERCLRGGPVETWICEHAASMAPERSYRPRGGPDPYMDYQGVGIISIETDGDLHIGHKAPHWARLVRDVREAVASLEKAVAS